MSAGSIQARIELARAVRDGIDEENLLALRLIGSGREARIAGHCQCGEPLDDPLYEMCAACGRDRGER